VKHTPSPSDTPLDRGDLRQRCLRSPLERGACQGGVWYQRPWSEGTVVGAQTCCARSASRGFGRNKSAPLHGYHRGFALVITLALLALLVLAVFALSALTRVSARIAATSMQQTQARQNALLALNVALGELQKHAGADERITAMAGVTGLAALSTNTTRHWCGVWTDSGGFVVWLSSGSVTTSNAAVQTGVPRVTLVGGGSVGASTANSEHVEVGKLPVNVVDSLTGLTRVAGNCAYWVGDEGVKVSAYSPSTELALAGVSPVLGSNPSTSATARLRAALTTYATKLPRIVAYEQLGLLPTPGSSALTPSVLQDSFHHTTLTAYRLVPQSGDVLRRTGMFNLNTNSASAWRGMLETYNAYSLGPPIASGAMGTSTTTSLPSRIANNLAAATAAGKAVNGPFTSVDSFATSALLTDALAASGSGVTAAELLAGIGPLLTVRSDTFRLRAYGDALDPVDQTTVRATAFVEATVQRIPDFAPNGLGRRFIIIHFRWLGPDDI